MILLLESGSALLLENSSKIEKENPPSPGSLLLESNDFLLLENGDRLQKEQQAAGLQSVQVPLIASTSQVFAPSVRSQQFLTPPTIGFQPSPGAAGFDSSNDILSQQTDVPTNVKTPFTIAGWIYRSSFSNDGWAWSVTDTGLAYNALVCNTSGNVVVGSNLGGSTVGSISTGQWYFVAMTQSGSTRQLKGYLGSHGGGPLLTATHTSIDNTDPVNNIYIAGGYYFGTVINGRMAGVKTWYAELSDAELEQERLSLAPVRTANLAGFYPLESASSVLNAITGTNLVNPSGAGTWSTESGPPIGYLGESVVYEPDVLQIVSPPVVASTATLFAPEVEQTGGVATLVQSSILASTAQLFAPTLTNINVLATSFVPSAEQIWSPTLNNSNTVAPPVLTSTEQFFASSLTNVNALATPFISSGAQVFEPSVLGVNTVIAPVLAASSQVYAPTVQAFNALQPIRIESSESQWGPTITSAVTLAAPKIDTTEQLFEPSVQSVSTLGVGLLNSTAQTLAPSLVAGGTVAPQRIENAAQLYEPSVNAINEIEAPAIGSTSQVFAPNLNIGIDAAFVPSTEQLFEPSIVSFNTLEAPLLVSGTQFFNSTASASNTISTPAIAPTTQVFAPTAIIDEFLDVPRIESSAQLWGPSVNLAAILQPPPVVASPSVFEPSLSAVNVIAIGSWSATSVVHSPTLSAQSFIQAPSLPSSTSVHTPSVVQNVAPIRVESQQQIFEPAVVELVNVPIITSDSVVFPPALSNLNTIATPLVDSTETLFGPNIALALRPPTIHSGLQFFTHNLVAGLGYAPEPPTLPLIRALELPLPTTVTRIVGIHQSDIVIRSAIEAALADLRANVWLLDYVFASLPQDSLTWKEYGEKDVQEAKKWFLSTNIPVSVLPRFNESAWPQITIELLESSEVVPETTIGDINYDPHEDNDSSWPPLTPPFTPLSYTPSTGLVVLAVEPEAMVGPGMFIIDRIGKAHEIVKYVSSKSFQIDPGTVADFRGAVIKGRRPHWRVDVESSSFRESYRIGIHCQNETVHLTWLHAIVQFALMRYKQVLLEARGFERSTIQSSQVGLDQRFEAENIFTRYITINGFVRQFWPKTIAPVINVVALDNYQDGGGLRVSGQNADVEVAKTGLDPESQEWIGNLDTIRTVK